MFKSVCKIGFLLANIAASSSEKVGLAVSDAPYSFKNTNQFLKDKSVFKDANSDSTVNLVKILTANIQALDEYDNSIDDSNALDIKYTGSKKYNKRDILESNFDFNEGEYNFDFDEGEYNLDFDEGEYDFDFDEGENKNEDGFDVVEDMNNFDLDKNNDIVDENQDIVDENQDIVDENQDIVDENQDIIGLDKDEKQDNNGLDKDENKDENKNYFDLVEDDNILDENKCGIMAINCSTDTTFKIQNQLIPSVNKYKYLGIEFNDQWNNKAVFKAKKIKRFKSYMGCYIGLRTCISDLIKCSYKNRCDIWVYGCTRWIKKYVSNINTTKNIIEPLNFRLQKNKKPQIFKWIADTEADRKYLTTRRYVKSEFIEKKFIEECPFCRNIAPETV
ncbi:hypothetical protein BB561_005357 [Smittium simulii]|uniref:Uncharacterized protein n=1 Tax=Smittium simulii TaxID=133385 RepID=A0A2T9YAR8_9FUNG|nr:hypothetical protein BB561_005357 [Smittium simulii]